ncbi:YceK/YidQ family lipoprotein [Pseudomonas sp. S31]|uniref:YceK/YidQ family lipoprotein n=1 Tax=Pseudomonas sp. S31 TaxID=1564473 RepID=UPI001914BD61|nr:YceK/YidQ family lipoprotein [Pseudomonas sp. S31]MBK4999824.1 YceK/YidQ family lipoprotein [Pseudomonas sp. S31]
MRRASLVLLSALVLGGCATVRTLDANKPGAPVVYAGTRLDLYVINGGCCPKDHFGADAPKYPGLDLPGSMLLDTLFLPLSLLTAAGIGFQATGGL